MNNYLGNELTLVELPAVEYLKSLGYDYIDGDKLTPEAGERDTLSDVILNKRMMKSLKKLNPWISDENAAKVIRQFERAENLGSSLLEINEKIYEYIVNLQITVDQVIDGRKETPTVHLIDFDNIDNNEFLVCRQFVVKGPQETIRPDIVIFINGMPIAVLECKSPFKDGDSNESVGKHDAYAQLRRYMNGRDANFIEGSERLFYTNFITGILNKYTAFIGTISSGYKHYVEWKDAYPVKNVDVQEYKETPQNILLQGVFKRENLLDIMQNFIVYDVDKENSRKVKKVCRYQQFRAVQKCINRIEEGKTPLEKGGVVWHTQGSGKSLTMVFLSRKIRSIKKLSDATIIIVTDRTDLDEQIFETLQNTLTNTVPVRAAKIEQMKELLRAANAQVITTTIQKFQSDTEEKELKGVSEEEKKKLKTLKVEKEYEVLSTKNNIIVMSDEAHRSQYKGTASNMRHALPNATFIGFTGTPIDKEDKSTPRTFGSYIDQYSIKDAVKDGATVKIVYEGRRPDLHISGDNLEELFDAAFDDRSDDEKEAIKQKYANKRSVIEADERIDEVAKDILKHYKEYIYPNGFKAQIVCVSREACVKYYNALNKHMKEIMGEELECKVIFSGDNNDEPYLREHHTTKDEQKAIIKEFKKKTSESKLCFLIVKDMLLTGFDAPIEQVMYLDRPLKEHTLLQAIARVNRTCGDTKKCGYVVDYFGVLDFLDEALAIFDKEDLGRPMESMDSLHDEMLSLRENVMRMFTGVNKDDLDALVKVLEPEDKRAEFEVAYKKFAGAVETLMPAVSKDIMNDVKWLSYIRAAAKMRFNPEQKLDIGDCGEKVKEIISEHLSSNGVIGWIEPITLFEDDFQSKIQNNMSDEAVASSMEHAIKNAIHLKMDENPVYYTSLFEKLQQILTETNNDWAAKKAKLQEFINKDMDKGEESVASDLGLTKQEFAIFETLRKLLQDGEENNKESIKEDSAVYMSDAIVDFTREFAKEFDSKMKSEWYMVGWSENATKCDDIEGKIYMFLISKSARIREVYGADTISKIKLLKKQLIDLAKIHYASID